jgi:hypothetical protein
MAVNKAATDNIEKDVSVLRIGVARERKVVSERLIQPGESVRIGPNTFNTFFLDEGFPSNFGDNYTLFESKGDTYSLIFNDDISGRVKTDTDSQAVYLKELVSSSRVKTKGKQYVLQLPRDMKGTVKVGEYSFIFQFIQVPAVAVKTMSQYKPRIFTDDDYVFFSFLGLFGMMAITALIWVGNQDRPVLLKKEEVEKMMAEMLDIEPEEPEEEPEPNEDEKIESDEGEPDKSKAKKEEKKEEKPEENKTKDTPKDTKDNVAKDNAKAQASKDMSANEEAAANEAVSNSFLFQQLGTTGNGTGKITSYYDGESGGGANLDKVLDGVTDGREAQTNAEVSVRGQIDKTGKNVGRINVEGASGSGGKSEAKEGPKVKAPPKAKRPKVRPVSAMGGCGGAINKTVRKYLGQVKSCHETAMKSNPKVSGRIVIDAEISNGKVVSARVAKNKTGNKTLGTCIQRRVKRWRFPKECSDISSFPFVLSPAAQ